MSGNTSSESSTPKEGPASLREALSQSFEDFDKDEASKAAAVNDGDPTDDSQLVTDDDPEAAAAAPSEDDADDSSDDSQGDDDTVIQAPEHWSAEDQAAFNGMPREAQEYVLRREKQYEQGIQSKSEELKPLREAFGPYRDILKMRGVDEATAIRTWVAAQSALDTDPVNGLKMLISQFAPEVQSAVLAEFGRQASASDDDSDNFDTTEINKLRRELNQTKQYSQQLKTEHEVARQQEALKQVQDFREAKDDAGNLLHPFFEDAQGAMRGLLLSGEASTLEDAYEKAVWSVPGYREHVAKQQEASIKDAERRKREEAAARAKKTAKAVNGKGNVPPKPPKKGTLRDDLASAWDESVRGG